MDINIISEQGFSFTGEKKAWLTREAPTPPHYFLHDKGGFLTGESVQNTPVADALTLLAKQSRHLYCRVIFDDTHNFWGERKIDARTFPLKELVRDESQALSTEYFVSARLEGKNPHQYDLPNHTLVEGVSSDNNPLQNFIAFSQRFGDNAEDFLLAQQRYFEEFYAIPVLGRDTFALSIWKEDLEVPYDEIHEVECEGTRLTLHAPITIKGHTHRSLSFWMPTPALTTLVASHINEARTLAKPPAPAGAIATAAGTAAAMPGGSGTICDIAVRGMGATMVLAQRARIRITEDEVAFTLRQADQGELAVSFGREARLSQHDRRLVICNERFVAQVDCRGLSRTEESALQAFAAKAPALPPGLHLFCSAQGPALILLRGAQGMVELPSHALAAPVAAVAARVTQPEAEDTLCRFELDLAGSPLAMEGSDEAVFAAIQAVHEMALTTRNEPCEKLLKALLGLEHQYWAFQSLGLVQEVHLRLHKQLAGTYSDEALPSPTADTLARYFDALGLVEWAYNHYLYTGPRRARSITTIIGRPLDRTRHGKTLVAYAEHLDRAFLRLKTIEGELRIIESKMRVTISRATRDLDSGNGAVYAAASAALFNPLAGLVVGAGRYLMEEDRKQKLSVAMESEALEGFADAILSWNRMYRFTLGPIYGGFMNDVFALSSRFWSGIAAGAEPGSGERAAMTAWCARLMTFLAWPSSCERSRGQLATLLIERVEKEPALDDSLLV